MRFIREHITFRILSLLLALSVSYPYVHRFDHLFTNHKDDICLGVDKNSSHLHEVNMNCDFYKFKVYIPHITPPVFNVKLFSPFEEQLEITSQYYFLNSYQQLHFSLRGPPALV